MHGSTHMLLQALLLTGAFAAGPLGSAASFCGELLRERPVRCCMSSSADRVLPARGDCCGSDSLELADPGGLAGEVPLPVADFQVLPPHALGHAASANGSGRLGQAARAPPLIPTPTRTVVLRL